MSDIPPPPGFTIVDDQPRRSAKRPAPPAGFSVLADDHPEASSIIGQPTGEVHDGDTFRLDNGLNARLYGADAFELKQTGRTRSGAVLALGEDARGVLQPYAKPDATVTATGSSTYGRPVALLERGGDAATGLLKSGYGIATPEYLKNDPAHLSTYMEAERDARLNRRGAWAGSFEQPSSFRHGTPDPWAKAGPATPGNGEAVFWDEPLPFQGLRPEIAAGYEALQRDPKTTGKDLVDYGTANGFKINSADADRYIARRGDPKFDTSVGTSYTDAPRVLTDLGDGKLGAGLRGVADPFNVLDEAGALVDTVGGTNGRENLWSSDRRFGDIYANNLDQNRSVLANDDAAHPYIRFAGQMAGGLVAPGASIEGLGFQAARDVLTAGGTRMAAEQAARSAVVRRLGTVGAVEGSVAGAGAGEDMRGRAEGALIGGPVGLALGVGTGVAAPVIAKAIGKPFSRLAGRDGERTASDFTDGAFDTAKAASENSLPNGGVGRADSMPMRAEMDTPSVVGPEIGAPVARPSEAVVHNIPPVDEASALGPKSVLGFVPPTGKPGVSVIDGDGHLAIAVYRDSDGVAKGAVQIPLTDEARGIYDGASAYVVPELRRSGIATQLYNELERAGYPIGEQSGRGDLTPDGASFVTSWRSRQPGLAGDDALRPIDRIDVSARPRPMMDPATDAERRAAAARLDPNDVLPIPANTVDGVEEAARIDAGRFDPVKAPPEDAGLSSNALPNANTGTMLPKRGPADLVTWLRSEGGIKAQGRELEHYGIDNTPRKGMDFAEGEQRFGPLVNNDGMTYDEAANRAWEAGYFPDHAERPDIAEFLDTLNATHTGNSRAFRVDDLAELDAFHAARRQRGEVLNARDNGTPLVDDRGQPIDMADLEANAPPVRAYEEWGENAPNLAGNIRLDKLDSPQAIRRALVQTDRVTGGFDAARRGRITHAETESLAGDLGMTVDDLLKRRKGEAFNAEQALGARQLLARSGTDLVNMAKKLSAKENPGDDLEAAFREAWVRHAAIQEQVSGMTAEAGRLLGQFRMSADSRAIADRVLPSLGDVGGGSGRLKEVADRIVDLERVGTDPGGVNKFALRALAPRWKDKLTELYINSLLSGPQTHAVNILSNTITALSQIPEQAVTAGVGAARQAIARTVGRDADVERVMFSEVGARTVGLIQGTREGLRDGMRALITGHALDPVTKLETQSMSAIGGKAGDVIRIPTRLLTAEDELFKGIARRMELTGLAMRGARLEGLSGEAANRRAGELLANPTDEMLSKSFDYARYLTFQNPLPNDSFAAGLSRATQKRPWAKIFLPFVRTPANILKFAAERSPLAVLSKSVQADFVAGGVRRDAAIARVLVGTGIGASIYTAAIEGKVTGGGPLDDSAKRLMMADGWQPYSFKVGDKYFSYARLDPFSTIIGTAADMADLSEHMTDKQRDNVTMQVGASIISNLSNKTWLSGISTMLDALNDPGRNLESFVARTAGSIAVPGVVAQVARTEDPVLRDARGVMDRIRSRIPGVSKTLPARRDVFGGAISGEGGIGPDLISPIWKSTAKNDPTIRGLLASDIHVNPPQRLDMTPRDYERYSERTGLLAKPVLDALVRGPGWLTMDREDQQAAVDGVLKTARKAAKSELGLLSQGAMPSPPPGFMLSGATPHKDAVLTR